jgi:hypothetical protein
MTTQEITLTLFTACNVVRIFGYLPQILRSSRDTSGAASTSIMTWVVFFAGNASATAYALMNVDDLLMATVFGVNALCCAIISLLTLRQRRRFRKGRISTSRKVAGQSSNPVNAARVKRPIGLTDAICRECVENFGAVTPRRHVEGREQARRST